MRESELAFFHNQKKGDFDPENNTIYESGTKDFDKYHKLQEKEKISIEIGSDSEVEKHIENILSQIDSIELESTHATDKEQIELLAKKKNQFKELLENVFKKADDYLETIRRMHNLKVGKDEMESSSYQDELENIERRRTSAHNALIADINIVNRFLEMNFGKIDEEMIEDWEEKEEASGRKVLYAKRIDLPKKGICVDRVDLNDRKSIADWAIQLMESLTKLKKRLSA
jgi:hypothetical protein